MRAPPESVPRVTNLETVNTSPPRHLRQDSRNGLAVVGARSDLASPSTTPPLAGRDPTRYGCSGRQLHLNCVVARLRKLLRRSLDRSSAGAFETMNPSDSETPPVPILGSVTVLVRLESDSRVRDVVVRVVDDLPYRFIFPAEYF